MLRFIGFSDKVATAGILRKTAGYCPPAPHSLPSTESPVSKFHGVSYVALKKLFHCVSWYSISPGFPTYSAQPGQRCCAYKLCLRACTRVFPLIRKGNMTKKVFPFIRRHKVNFLRTNVDLIPGTGVDQKCVTVPSSVLTCAFQSRALRAVRPPLPRGHLPLVLGQEHLRHGGGGVVGAHPRPQSVFRVVSSWRWPAAPKVVTGWG